MRVLNFPVALIAGSALLLSACTQPGAYEGGVDPNQKAKTGAIIGGLLGAGLGAASNASNKKTAVLGGAALGAIAGGAIGGHLDRQAAELREQLQSDGITVVNAGDRLIVSLPNDITFASGSYQVSPGLRSDLGRVSQHLLRYPDSAVQVIGHTDSDGEATYNLGLSHQRANAVADILQAGGVPFNRLQTRGMGEEQPVASNLTPDGKARNRRVEIVVIPNS